MKIRLDTTTKTIQIEESVNIGEFIGTLENLLGPDKWKDFRLQIISELNWNPNPTYIDRRQKDWWHYPWFRYDTPNDSTAPRLELGTFGIAMKDYVFHRSRNCQK